MPGAPAGWVSGTERVTPWNQPGLTQDKSPVAVPRVLTVITMSLWLACRPPTFQGLCRPLARGWEQPGQGGVGCQCRRHPGLAAQGTGCPRLLGLRWDLAVAPAWGQSLG